jgi:hypothetical protein
MKRFILLAVLSIAGLLAGCATTTTAPPASAAPAAAAGHMPAPSGDDMVASDGHDSVRLTQHPCPPAILAMIPADLHAKVKAAVATVDGKDYSACWLARPGGVILQYEDGDQGVVPMRDFRRGTGV